MKGKRKNRRTFLKNTAAAVCLSPVAHFYILPSKSKLSETILGHGDYRYRVDLNWGNLDPNEHPVKDCHEMIMDKKGRLIMVGNETKNNVLIYDKSGKLLDYWGSNYQGGHGLTLWDKDDEEMLFICDTHGRENNHGAVVKCRLNGQELMTIEHPSNVGAYDPDDKFSPTETTIGPSGDIYVADGYGSQYILQYTAEGEFIRKFGGQGDEDDQFQTPHGVCIDYRSENPTLLVCSRAHNSFKRFTLDGQFIETLFLPGAYVCRPVIDGEQLYAGVCWSRLKYLNQTPNSGFVTILDKNNQVISNPGGTAPTYIDGKLQIMVQDQPIFKHCHDVCIDEDKNIYVCQWNAGNTYPIRLVRV